MILNFVNVYFYVRESKVKGKRGNLYVRVNVNGDSIVASVKTIKLFASDFKLKTQSVKPTCDIASEVTNFMIGMRKRLIEIQTMCERKRKRFTKEHLIKEIQTVYIKSSKGLEVPEAITFMNCFDAFLSEQKKEVGITISKGTYGIRERYRKIISGMENLIHELTGPVDEVSLESVEEIKRELRRRYAQSTASKVWNVVSMVFEHAKKKHLVYQNPCKEAGAIPLPEVDPDWIEQNILIDLANVSVTDAEEKYRDAFLFCCYTGLAVGDYLLLHPDKNKRIVQDANSPKNIKPGKLEQIGKNTFLIGTRRKTGTEYRVPILPQAQAILDKYHGLKGLPYGLYKPGLVLNSMFKRIGYSKEVRFHNARASMANYLINDMGIDPYYARNIMGWKKIEEADPYVKVKEETLAKKMFTLIPSKEDA